MPLTQDLMSQHQAAVKLLQEADAAGVGTAQWQQKVTALVNALGAHVQKEDRDLYPKLNAAAQKDPGLKVMLDMFAKNMDLVVQKMNALKPHLTGTPNSAVCAKDWGAFKSALSERVRREETQLYPAFDKL